MRISTTAIGFIALCSAAALTVGGCGGIIDEQANARFVERVGDMSVTVYPVFVRDGEQKKYDAAAAQTIADFLAQSGLASVAVSGADVPITSQWGSNQAKMFRDSAADFSSYVREHPIETDYALLPEYLIGGRGTPVGVHLYLVDPEGAVAYAFLNNSHHKVFTDVDPKTVGDCTTIAINNLREDLADRDEAGKVAKTSDGESVREKRLAVMRAKGGEASLTIFPVRLGDGGRPRKDVGDALALLLEQGGMTNLEPVATVFEFPPEADFDQAAEPFGEFVRQNPIQTDYALYAEILGTPQTGPSEIRGVVVDRAGECVWVDRQTPDDPDFKRLKPDCPLTCCNLLSERLRAALNVEPGDTEGEGRLARMWAQRSGNPDRDELTAMDERLAAMRAAMPAARLAVFPVRLGNADVNQESAANLAKLINEQKLCSAETLGTTFHIELERSSNEQKTLWDMARAFREHVRQNPPEADYVLYADYLISPRGDHVGAVHFAICDRAGEWVIVDFQNSHHDDFQSVDPKSRGDCDRLVLKRLEGYLR